MRFSFFLFLSGFLSLSTYMYLSAHIPKFKTYSGVSLNHVSPLFFIQKRYFSSRSSGSYPRILCTKPFHHASHQGSSLGYRGLTVFLWKEIQHLHRMIIATFIIFSQGSEPYPLFPPCLLVPVSFKALFNFLDFLTLVYAFIDHH